MNQKILIEIENTKYTELFSLDGPKKHELNLTTIADNQKRAFIKIILKQDRERHTLHVFDVKNLQPKPAGTPRFFLSAAFNGKKRLKLNLHVDGVYHSTESLDISSFIKKEKSAAVPLIAGVLILLLLLGAGSYVFIFSRPPTETTDLLVTAPEPTEPDGTSLLLEEKDDIEIKPEIEAPAEPEIEAPAEPEEPAEPEIEAPAESTEPAEPEVAADGPYRAETDPEAEEIVKEPEQRPYTLAGLLQHEEPLPKVYFRPDNPALTPATQQALHTLVPILNEAAEYTIHIAGHCALSGTERGRKILSEQRAENVASFLRSIGWEPETEPVITGQGGNRPLTRDPEEQHINRRVEIFAEP